MNMIAEAFEKIGNPLAVVSFGENCARFMCPNAIFTDKKVSRCKEDILGILFPVITTPEGTYDSSKQKLSPKSDDQVNNSNRSSSSSSSKHRRILKKVKSKKSVEDERSSVLNTPTNKVMTKFDSEYI